MLLFVLHPFRFAKTAYFTSASLQVSNAVVLLIVFPRTSFHNGTCLPWQNNKTLCELVKLHVKLLFCQAHQRQWHAWKTLNDYDFCVQTERAET